jgi:NAD(P)-dependent dehydrogenase (short-subunit alcohol dehydrogenase family)
VTDSQELAGRVAVVTGAGRNIGRAIALALAEAGAAVVVNVRANRAEADAVVAEIEAGGGRAAAHVGDVADAQAAASLAETALSRFQRIDCLVNNAALRGEKPFGEMTYDEWRSVLGVTLDGAFHCTQACLPALKQNGGAVINIGGLTARWRTISPPTASPPTAWCRAPSTPRVRPPRRGPRTISPTAPSPASAAGRKTSPPWCACSPARTAASSPGRRST